MRFEINNDEWEIFIVPSESIKKRYNEDNNADSTFVFGLTIYPEHAIWINDTMCLAEQIKTLRHELTHCYIWSYGLYNAPHYTEEMVCDIVAASHGIIDRIVNEFVKDFLEKS